MFSAKEIISVTLILFSVIDIVGNVPVVIDLRKRSGSIQSGKATVVAGLIMILFLFLGQKILGWFGIDIGSFAITGALIMFFIGLELTLGITLFKPDTGEGSSSSIVPLAFPLMVGPGTMTALISLRAEYEMPNILIGIVINTILIYVVLKSSTWLERKLGVSGFNILRKVFGIILLAIAIKLFKNALAIW